MEFLPNSLKEVVSKLNENQKEEIDIIESLVNTNERNKENEKEKLFRFIEKRESKSCILFIVGCLNHAALIIPKERETFFFLFTSIFNKFHLNFEIKDEFKILRNMLQVKNIIPYDRFTEEHIFDFEKEGTVERAIFEDNIVLLQQLLAVNSDEGKEQIFDIYNFFPYNEHLEKEDANRVEVSALFGSTKCFKYLMANGDEINEETCKFAVAGGNFEIIHFCEQKGLQFEECLFISSLYHFRMGQNTL